MSKINNASTGDGESSQTTNGHQQDANVEKTFEPHTVDEEKGTVMWLERDADGVEVATNMMEELGIEEEDEEND